MRQIHNRDYGRRHEQKPHYQRVIASTTVRNGRLLSSYLGLEAYAVISPSLTRFGGGAILAVQRESVVKRATWTLLMCLFGALALLALPPVDAPETAFNELDTPVNVAHPALPRVSLTAPKIQPAVIPQSTPSLNRNERTSNRIELLAQVYDSPDLQPLLCTFLI
jgi:hypothetical protein